MKNRCFIIAFVFAAFCTMSAFGYQTENQRASQSNSDVQHAFMERSDAVNSELLSNNGVVQISRVLNGLLKSDVAEKGNSSSKTKAVQYFKQASKLFDQEEYDDALDNINKALKLDPKNSKFEQLKEEIEEAIEEVERQEEADEHANRAVKLSEQTKFDEALLAIDKALKMFPDNRKYKRLKEKIEDAKADYEEQEKQNDAQELIDDAKKLLNSNKFDEALKKVDKAEKIYPNDKSSYNTLRRTIKNAKIDYEEQEKLEEAATLAKQALECLKQNRFDEALRCIEDALAIEPSNASYKRIKEEIVLAKDPFSPQGKEAGARAVKEINGEEFAFRWCPPGTFTAVEFDKRSNVTLTKGFWMMETEVTVGMFRAFVNETSYKPYESNYNNQSWLNPGFSQTNAHPVTFVSWADAKEFCKWLSRKTGFDVQLPSKAQSVYAAQAGTMNPGNVNEIAWYYENSSRQTHPVANKKPNAWGMYDMYGNVEEWCADSDYWFSENNKTDPFVPDSGLGLCHRGGSYQSDSELNSMTPGGSEGMNDVGFRCLIKPSQGN